MNRRIIGATAVALATGVAGFGAVAGATTTKAVKGKADSGTTYASIVHSANGYQYAAGTGTDQLLGTDAITYRIKLSPGTQPATETITASPVVLYTKTGALTGTATATLVFVGTTEQIKDGKLKLTSGSGSLKGHSFTGTFTGTGNTTANQFVFQDKGTLK